MWSESVVVSADQLLSKVNSMPVQTDKTSSQFLDTAGAVPLCRAERGSVHGDTDKVSRHLPFPSGPSFPGAEVLVAAGVEGGPGAGVG